MNLDPGRESCPGPLQGLGTWVPRATNQAKRRPIFYIKKMTITVRKQINYKKYTNMIK